MFYESIYGLFSNRCEEEFQLRSSQSYMRFRVLEAEHGVCQHCGLHAHDLFLKVRDAPPSQRKEILENTWLSQLSLKQVFCLTCPQLTSSTCSQSWWNLLSRCSHTRFVSPQYEFRQILICFFNLVLSSVVVHWVQTDGAIWPCWPLTLWFLWNLYSNYFDYHLYGPSMQFVISCPDVDTSRVVVLNRWSHRNLQLLGDALVVFTFNMMSIIVSLSSGDTRSCGPCPVWYTPWC